MPTPLSLADTIARVQSAAPPVVQTKVASPVGPSGALRELASLLRNVPDAEVTFASLYAVKEAGYRSTFPSQDAETPVDASRTGAPLRKLAQVVRSYEHARAAQFFEKNARILRALRGLTLLHEQANSR